MFVLRDMCWGYRLEFKAEDAWVGVFWKHGRVEPDIKTLDVWVCLVPFFPIHFQVSGYEH